MHVFTSRPLDLPCILENTQRTEVRRDTSCIVVSYRTASSTGRAFLPRTRNPGSTSTSLNGAELIGRVRPKKKRGEKIKPFTAYRGEPAQSQSSRSPPSTSKNRNSYISSRPPTRQDGFPVSRTGSTTSWRLSARTSLAS